MDTSIFEFEYFKRFEFGHCAITKSDSRMLSATLMFCFIYILQGNFF